MQMFKKWKANISEITQQIFFSYYNFPQIEFSYFVFGNKVELGLSENFEQQNVLFSDDIVVFI